MNPHETAAERLARNRSDARRWLEHDRHKRAQFNESKLGQWTHQPWLRQLTAHPVTSMALGAFAKWWMRPRTPSSSPTVGMLAAGAGLGLLRRRPVLTLVTAAAVVAVLMWKNRNHRIPPPTP
jgi:hypothetical protein